ncbi:poly [ADP-ribose] polymerase 14-like isoform X2 [Pomacea canaliculata]|uniref:poly [ADP-ribose] polymerase 14-like isoform X2 n=1 Tax=Pomacea canaliculata TaxID=400727 RepID=UPI000D73789C|nr:poly [ADP-ribose] polymerase 14-like isoform X2 [Pomacea canaliculata]
MNAFSSAVQFLIRGFHEYWSPSTPKYQNDPMDVETCPEKHAEYALDNESHKDEQMDVDSDSNESDELCEETHQREQEVKDQERLRCLETEPFYPKKLFFKNVAPCVSTEFLVNYLKNITGQDCVDLLYSNEPGGVLATFKTELYFAKVKKKCQKKLLNKRHLEVWRVPVSNSILVENLSPNTDPNHVSCYFETPRAKGGTVLAVKQVRDRTKCVVFFEDKKATEGVLKATHRLGGRKLRVSLYLECLGPSGGRTEPYIFVPPPPVELTEADDLKVCFVTHSADILQSFNDHLSQVHAHASVVENVLKVNCTLTESMHSVHILVETWRENVKKQLTTCLSSVRLQRIKVPPEVWEEVKTNVEECGVCYGDLVLTRKEEKDFLVLGRSNTKGDTFEKIQSIVKVKQEEFEVRKQTVNCTIKLKKHQLDLVKSSSFLSDLGTQDGGPRVDIHFQDEEITFQGQLTAIREAQVKMFDVINATFSMAVTNIPDCQQRLLATDTSHEAVRKKLTAADLAASWECYNEGVVVVYSLKQSCLNQAACLIQTSFKSETIFVKESSSSLLKTSEWKCFKEKLLEENCGLLTIITNLRTIFITAFCDIMVAVKEEVRKFVSENTIYSTVFKLSPSRMKFVALFWENKLALIASSLKVKITVQDDKKDILVRGTKNGIENAKRELSSLEKQIICIEEEITRKETVSYLTDLKDISTLDAFACTRRCVLSLHPEPQMVPTDQPSLSPPKVHALLKDITQLSVDVIVNAANERMDHAGGLARHIVLKGGIAIQKECYNILKTRGKLSEGDVLVSGPGKLPCKSIIHAVGPRYKGGNKGEEECLQATVLECLKTATDLGYTSIAFPAISSGIFGYPVREATRVIVEAVRSFFSTNTDSSIIDVRLVDILPRTIQDFEKALEGASNQQMSTDLKSGSPGLVLVTPGGEHKKRTIVPTIIRDINLLNVDAVLIAVNTGMFHFGDIAKIREIKEECQESLKTKGELSEGDVLVLGPGKLPFKSIIHAVGPRLKDGDEGEEEWIRATVTRYLETASDRGYTSIALPAISSRVFGYSVETSVRVIVDTLKAFFNINHDSSVIDVRLIDGFSHNVQEFERVLSSGSLESNPLPAASPEPSIAPGAASSEPSDRTILSNNQSSESQSEAGVATQQTDGATENPVNEATSHTDGPARNASMIALAVDITQLNVDAIVNPINKDLDISYRVAKRVVETGGTEIQEECRRLLEDMGELSEGDVLVSGPGKLRCKSIIHVVIPTNAEDDKVEESMLTIVVKCLETASERGYTSIALPLLTSNTWVFTYTDKLAARATVKAVRGFSPCTRTAASKT